MGDRVWDRFLTEDDKRAVAHLPTAAWGLGSAPVLLMVDLYRKAFGDTVDPAAPSWSALPHLRQLLQTARDAEIPIVYITGLTDFPRWSDGYGGARSQDRTEVGSEERRKAYEIIPELVPLDGEPVVLKAGPSGFWGTPLPGLLNRLGADSLIVCGTATSGCVRATVVEGRSYQYRIAVVEECVFDRHQASHAISLFDMNRKYADVVSLDWAETYIKSLR